MFFNLEISFMGNKIDRRTVSMGKDELTIGVNLERCK